MQSVVQIQQIDFARQASIGAAKVIDMQNSKSRVDVFHPEFSQERLCHSDTAGRCGLDNACPHEGLNIFNSAEGHLEGPIKR